MRIGIKMMAAMGCLISVWAVHAEVPTMMSYQGLITSGGEPVDGTGYFKFALVDTFGAVRWTHDGTGVFPPAEPTSSVEVPVENGLFMVHLGDTMLANMQALGGTVFLDNTPLSLRIWFSEDNVTFEQLAPDQQIAAAGYAMQAQHVPPNSIGSGQLAPLAVTAFQIANGAVTADKLGANSVTSVTIENNAVTADKLAANSVTGAKIVNATITSNKIDWTTMPPRTPHSYAERGTFALVPVADGNQSVAIGMGARALGDYSAIGGGYSNVAHSIAGTVAGGYLNSAEGWYATVAGGVHNRADGNYASVGGGQQNLAALRATVSGGEQNRAVGEGSVIGGGQQNIVSNFYGTVAGGQINQALDDYATVGGGYWNAAGGNYSTVAGGRENSTVFGSAFVGGGAGNRAEQFYSVVAGGMTNVAGGHYSAIGGGSRNEILAQAHNATIAGGSSNTAEEFDSAIGGGTENKTTGWYATIPGGIQNEAVEYAFAAGRRAKANHAGSFVWGDSTDANIGSSANDQVTFRCNGGVRFTSGTGVGNHTIRWAPGAGSWTVDSDRAQKEGFVPVDTHAVLEKVAALPLTEWNYVGYEQRHIGPMAQDFHAAFPLAGSSDTALNSLHLDGVALAAIQGLYAEVGSQQSEVSRLQAENAELKQKNGELEARLERLEAMVGALIR